MEKKDLANRLMETMRERFQSLENLLFDHMSWMDLKVWKDERTYGNESLEYLANHFKVTLEKACFQKQKLIPEWKRLKIYVKSLFESKLIRDETNARKIWNHILLSCKKRFPNAYLLIQICFSIRSSNAATERAFNLLTLLLSDRKTKMQDQTTPMLSTICINENLWDEGEKSEIINAAVNIHLEKRWKKMDQEKEQKFKKKMLVEFKIVGSKSEDESESEEESKSEDENGFLEDSGGLI